MTILKEIFWIVIFTYFPRVFFFEILVIADWSNNKVARKITLEPEMKPKDEI
jgi:hypothetical protein